MPAWRRQAAALPRRRGSVAARACPDRRVV